MSDSEKTNGVEDFGSSVCYVVSFGGGVNSTALLIELANRNEPPDVILFADTGGEKPETYMHIEAMQGWLLSHGMPAIEICSEKKTLEADCLDRGTLPGKAFGFGSCSEHFKVRPQRRHLKSKGIKNPMWLVGIHAGEAQRALRMHNQRSDVSFPLIQWGWGQKECEQCILDAGLQIPVKSACFYCPSMRKPEIIQLSKQNPELFERAVEMEDNAKECGTLKTVKGLGRSYSWDALVKSDNEQLKLFDDFQDPICDTCIDW